MKTYKHYIILVSLIFQFAATGLQAKGLFKFIPAPTSPVPLQIKQTGAILSYVDTDFSYLFEKVTKFKAEKQRSSFISFFDELDLKVVVERVNSTSPNHFNLTGSVEGILKGDAIFVVKNGRMFGNIRLNGILYKIIPTKAGKHIIYEVDPRKFPKEHPNDTIEDTTNTTNLPTNEPDQDKNDGDISIGADSEATKTLRNLIPSKLSIANKATLVLKSPVARPFVTLMAIYTKEAKDSSIDIESEIELTVLETNRAYSKSGIKLRLSLNYVGQVNYTESGNIITDRDRLKNPSDGFMDGIHKLRNKYSSDLVSLWTKKGGGYCGMAYIMKKVKHSFQSSAFSVVKLSCANGNFSFAHELGHNQSARHDRYVDNTNNSPYKYNHGYVNMVNRWRTIMSYNDKCEDNGTSCPRLGYFSNPQNKYNGKSMGIASGSKAADNHKTLNNTASTVARFRTLGQNEAGDTFAYALASGDFNNDGYMDLAVGAPFEAPGSAPKSGYVFVFKGTKYGLAPWYGLSQAGLGVNENGDQFGYALAAGDFNGDGKDDLAVGAPGESPAADPKSGYVFVFKGTSKKLVAWKGLDQTDLGVNENGDRFGESLAIGDFNGDGKDDLAVGAPGESIAAGPKSGYVFTFKGQVNGLIAWKGLDQDTMGVNEQDDQFGKSLAAGDFNGDGKDDLAVGAPREAPGSDPKSGYVFTFKGGVNGLQSWKGLEEKDLGAVNEAGDLFGRSLAVGDFNGDGKDDLAVGAPGEAPGSDPKSGYVFTFKGQAGGLIGWKGLEEKDLGAVNEAGDQFGRSLTSGDYNGDGISDLVIAAPYEAPGSDPKSGYVFAYKGNATTGLKAWKGFDQNGLGVNENGDRFGWSLASGDFNGDLKTDLVVGAPYESPGSEPRSGYAFIFSGFGGLSPWHGIHQEQ